MARIKILRICQTCYYWRRYKAGLIGYGKCRLPGWSGPKHDRTTRAGWTCENWKEKS